MTTFSGFDIPRTNWSKLPHALIEAMPLIETAAEMKVILYILRHTWGYHESEKRITLDEFQSGRKYRDGSRIDGGTGMSRNAIKDGIKRAIEHGFIIQEIDGRDAARSSHVYSLALSQEQDRGSNFDPQVSEIDPQPSNFDPRSEKETIERKTKKEIHGGRDFLDDTVDLKERLFPGTADRPKGWRAMPGSEYAVCVRVAEHWRGGDLPRLSKFIEQWEAAAAELLRIHGGDERATLKTIDRYHEKYRKEKRDFDVVGPMSLLNVIPVFLADQQEKEEKKVRYVIVPKPVGEQDDDQGEGASAAVGHAEPQGAGDGARRPRGAFSSIRRSR